MKWDSIVPQWSLFAYTPFVINFSTFPFFLFIEKKIKQNEIKKFKKDYLNIKRERILTDNISQI